MMFGSINSRQMRYGCVVSAAIACCLLGFMTDSRAGVIFNIQQTGRDVTGTISGSFNTSVDGVGSQALGSGSVVQGGASGQNSKLYFTSV